MNKKTSQTVLAILLCCALLLGRPVLALAAEEKTMLETVIELIDATGIDQKQFANGGQEPSEADYTAFALSLGMVEEDADLDAVCSPAHRQSMEAVAASLKAAVDALNDRQAAPLFLNGMAQPLFAYTPLPDLDDALEDPSENPNDTDGDGTADTDVIRCCVYVETDHDTDADGQLDLVKVLLQMPRAAAEGQYRAATVFQALPYSAGVMGGGMANEAPTLQGGGVIGTLRARPEARTPAGDAVSTLDAAESAQLLDWLQPCFYQDPDTGESFWTPDWYGGLTSYDYYLVRGYTVALCAGLGTLGSEGLSTCGTTVETDAFRAVVEWLSGDGSRMAYLDRTGCIPVSNGWSNGSVGMTGVSYGGTIPFGVACTGVPGLKAIIPMDGIGNWYEYNNSQGTGRDVPYSSSLAWFVNSRRFTDTAFLERNPELEIFSTLPDDWNALTADGVTTIGERQALFYGEIDGLEQEMNGDYGEQWAERDYVARMSADGSMELRCAALVLEGQNDYNVAPRNAMLMFDTFRRAGQPGKIILHQAGHTSPSTYGSAFLINGERYDDICNRWFSYYLYRDDRDAAGESLYDLSAAEEYIKGMPDVTAQDCADPEKWYSFTAEQWESTGTLTLNSADGGDISFTSDLAQVDVFQSTVAGRMQGLADPRDVTPYPGDPQKKLTAGSTPVSAMYTATVEEDAIIAGTPTVRFSASAFMPEDHETVARRMQDDAALYGELTQEQMQDDAGIRVDWADSPFEPGDIPETLAEMDNLMVSAWLVDLPAEGAGMLRAVVDQDGLSNTVGSSFLDNTDDPATWSYWMGGGLTNGAVYALEAEEVLFKVISKGWADLCNPGAARSDVSCTAPGGSAAKKTLGDGEKQTYTIELEPVVYRLEAGHRLGLVLLAFDPTYIEMDATLYGYYGVTVDNGSVSASVPVRTGGQELSASLRSPAEDPVHPVVDAVTTGVGVMLDTHIAYMAGRGDGVFAPDEEMTRAEAAQVFTNLLREEYKADFPGSPEDPWYTRAINTMRSLGIMGGVDLEADRPVTRAEFAAMAVHFAQAAPETLETRNFSDVEEDDWFYDAVALAVLYGWMEGYNDGTFKPDGPLTRVEAAWIVNRMLGRSPDVDLLTAYGDARKPFSDVDRFSCWGYYEILEATASQDGA